MVANYTVKGESFVADKPRVWFGKQLANLGLAANFDLALDGKRFAVLMSAESPEPRETQSHVKIAVNFLRRCAAGRRLKANDRPFNLETACAASRQFERFLTVSACL